MGQLIDGHALARRIGFRIPCITHPCSHLVTTILAELDPVLVAMLLAALVVLLLASRLRYIRPCLWVWLACAYFLLTILLLLLPSRAMLQRLMVGSAGLLRAGECIALSAPGMKLTQPKSAEEHFTTVHAALRPWLHKRSRACTGSGYCGMQVEDLWITTFGGRAGLSHRLGLSNASAPVGALRATFGPYVPLFLPWNALERQAWGSGHRYPRGLLEAVERTLRTDVLYVTVSQSDMGLFGGTALEGAFRNVLVLSAGGFGHVPLPLLQKPLHALRPARGGGSAAAGAAAGAAAANQSEHETTLLTPPAERPLLASYVGSLGHAPHSARQWMCRLAEVLRRRLHNQ